MFPRIALGTVGALVLSTVLIVPTTAKAKPITGNVTCTLSGDAVISPGLLLSADCSGGKTCPTGFQCTTSGGSSVCMATKKSKTTTTFTGTLSNCTGTQMNTKKGAQIDGGTVTASAKTTTAVGQPLGSCLGLTAPTTPTVLAATVKFTSGGKVVATSKAKLSVGAAVLGSDLTVSFPASGTVSGGTAFKGQTLTATAILDDNEATLPSLCAGGASTDFSFKGIQGESTLDVAP